MPYKVTKNTNTMRDEHISLPRLNTLHPAKRDNFKAFIETSESELNITIRIATATRTFAEQDAEYAKGRTAKGPQVTAAKGGESWHCYGLAFDLVILENGKPNWFYNYTSLYAIAERFGISNGSAWKDNDHFEDNLGHGPSGWKWALDKWNKKDVTDGYINL